MPDGKRFSAAFEEKLVESGLVTAAELEGIKAAVKKELDAALEFAQSSPLPELSALLEDVYA